MRDFWHVGEPITSGDISGETQPTALLMVILSSNCKWSICQVDGVSLYQDTQTKSRSRNTSSLRA